MDVDANITQSDTDSTGTEGTEIGEVEPSLDERAQAWRAEDARRYQALRQQSRAVYRAMDGWAAVRDEEAWHRLACRRGRTITPAGSC